MCLMLSLSGSGSLHDVLSEFDCFLDLCVGELYICGVVYLVHHMYHHVGNVHSHR